MMMVIIREVVILIIATDVTKSELKIKQSLLLVKKLIQPLQVPVRETPEGQQNGEWGFLPDGQPGFWQHPGEYLIASRCANVRNSLVLGSELLIGLNEDHIKENIIE